VARALDDGGLVFEGNRITTLPEAMAALEAGLAEWFRGQRTDLRSPSPRVQKTQRRPRGDA
jgi:hypothetical protein